MTRAGRLLGVVLCCSVLAGCGGSTADRVCGRARAAAAVLVRDVEVRTAESSSGGLECVLRGEGTRVEVVVQTSAQAWTEYDTAVVHQVQAFGSGPVHVRAQLPQPVFGVGGAASWIPAQRELLATNASRPGASGSYLEVTVTRSTAHAPRTLARAVARSVLAVAPR